MLFHYEYTDSDGKPWSATLDIPSSPRDSVAQMTQAARKHIAMHARPKGWTNIQIWHPDFPFAERMKRINAIQKRNGNPELHSEEAIAEADKPHREIEIAHFDQEGKMVGNITVPPLAKNPIGRTVLPGAAALTTKIIPIMEHGPEAETATGPVPIENR